MNVEDKTHDILLTTRSVGDGDSTIAPSHTTARRDSIMFNQEDMVTFKN